MSALSGDELAVLNAIRERLEKGKRQYGQLDLKKDKRDWLAELQEELLDACVYLECEKRKRRRVKMRNLNRRRVSYVYWVLKCDDGYVVGHTARSQERKSALPIYNQRHAEAEARYFKAKLIRVTRYKRVK